MKKEDVAGATPPAADDVVRESEHRLREMAEALERAEQRLRESEDRFTRFMQHLPGLAWIKDSDGRYIYANDAAQAAFQARPGDLYGKTDQDIFPSQTAAQFKEHDREVLTAGSGVQRMEMLEHADGVVHHSIVSKFAIPQPKGHGPLVGGIAIDITELGLSFDAAQRDQVAETHARLAALVESSDDAIVSKDLNGVITSWNAGAQRLFGYTAEETVGQSVTMLIPPERYDEEPGVLSRIRRGEKVDHYETVRRRKDGTYIDVSLTVSPIRNFSGAVVGASKIARDITESKRSAAMLADANRRKDEFLAMLAHELRNPLAPILGSLEILSGAKGGSALDGADERDRQTFSAIDVLRRQVGQMVRLVDDLLDASRISRGKIELRRQNIDLSSAVHDAVEAVQVIAEGKGQELTVTLPPAPVVVNADPTRLAQIVGNLLNNASKFTDRGGHISLTVERIAHAEGSQEAAIRVRDTGIGIADDQLSRVFEMFTQVDSSRERSSMGLGIGLTLARTLTELHGGTLEARSAGIGQGSEFVVRLPVAESAAPAASPQPVTLEVSVPLRILVVDDNRDAATMLAMLLDVGGHETHVVYDGLAAVDAVTTFDPDVVLLDIGLPGLNGYEAARRIREMRGGTLRRPVLMALTGWGQDEDRRRSQEAGFDAHLVKPVDAGILGKMLADTRGRR